MVDASFQDQPKRATGPAPSFDQEPRVPAEEPTAGDSIYALATLAVVAYFFLVKK